MKTNFLLFFTMFVLSSCVDVYGPVDDPERFGFYFRITNYTSETYTNAEITIGTIADGEFIASETLKLPTIPKSGEAIENGSTSYLLFDDRWQPNLENIERASFKLKLNEEREGFIWFREDRFDANSVKVQYINIPENKIITNRGDDSVSFINFAIQKDIDSEFF